MNDRAKRDWIGTLRHMLGTLAYRTNKVLADVPEGFPDFEAGHGVRNPQVILSHMGDVIASTRRALDDSATVAKVKPPQSWAEEVERFRAALEDLDRTLARCTELQPDTAARLLQGPLSDAMTHVGQLAMLKRMAGAPIEGENFFEADIGVITDGP